ncbi:MAG: hypothetical protein KIT72_03355 [Polyangiaceae bacterium]|nr:hypothetical protein [Polyangiaceae bacterium]MCW5789437.1 hypothetical protein [Polyangiaceae bacterium]
MWCRSWALPVVSLAASLLLGCGSKDSVALSAHISQAELELDRVTLGAVLAGGFEVTLELGPEASEATEVSLEAFALAPANGGGDLAVSFAPEAAERFPLKLGVGELKRVEFSLPQDILSADAEAELCQGPIEIRGALRDTLSGGGLTSLRSRSMEVTGCR